jgi:hypothetical protein
MLQWRSRLVFLVLALAVVVASLGADFDWAYSFNW